MSRLYAIRGRDGRVIYNPEGEIIGLSLTAGKDELII